MNIQSAMEKLRKEAGEVIKTVNPMVYKKAYRVANALRNAELEVMTGTRSGRVYKKRGTHGKRKMKGTKALEGEYGHKLRGGQLYRASAPGEAPAAPTGSLRRSFTPIVKGAPSSAGFMVISSIESRKKYAAALQNGSKRIAARPYMEPIIEKARPEIDQILNEPFT